MKPLVIYHGNCADGFAAAWAVWKAHPDWEFYPGVHQQPPPDVTGREVYMVDFSYKRPVIEAMSKQAETLTILDHHKSACIDLQPLLINATIMYGRFDMDQSGSMITWNYFHEDEDAPELLLYIQDRDLWLHELPGTREVSAALFSYPYDFAVWDGLMEVGPKALFSDGVSILRKQEKDIAELIQGHGRAMIGGCDVPIVNLPYTMGSDACNILAKGEPFAAYYMDRAGTRTFGLRSRQDGVDVSEVAKLYGGGGHKHASGFALSIEEAEKRIPRC